MIKPAVAFEDPRPFVHFSNVPIMKAARKQLVHQCAHTLPSFDKPVRFMDIGCGDGALTVMLLSHLLEFGKVNELFKNPSCGPFSCHDCACKKDGR